MRAALAALMLLFLLTACGPGPSVPEAVPDTAAETTEETTDARTSATKRPAEAGTLHAAPAASPDLPDFDRIREISVDREGEEVLLYSDGRLRNFMLARGTLDPDTGNFSLSRVLYTAKILDAGEALRFTVQLPDTVPDLRITFTGADGDARLFLTRSEEDGAVLLAR